MNYNLTEQFNIRNFMPTTSQIKTLTTFFYAFSDPTRLKIIILLCIKPVCVGDISSILKINQTTVSHQLKILKAQNLVNSNRSGKNIYYYIKNDNIEQVLNASVSCI